MSISARLKDYLDQQHSSYSVVNHPLAYTTQGVASVLHLDGKQVAKAVVVHVDEGQECILAVLPTCHHVDLRRLSEVVGRPLRLATEHEFGELFPDRELGAMPPLGNLYGLRVYVDQSLSEDKEIVFNGGTHREAIRMSFEEFKRFAQPVICAFIRKASHEDW